MSYRPRLRPKASYHKADLSAGWGSWTGECLDSGARAGLVVRGRRRAIRHRQYEDRKHVSHSASVVGAAVSSTSPSLRLGLLPAGIAARLGIADIHKPPEVSFPTLAHALAQTMHGKSRRRTGFGPMRWRATV